MSNFRYVHNDGRTGIGWSTWDAIVAAVGGDEAARLMDAGIRDVEFHHSEGRDYYAKADLLTADGEKIGGLFKIG